MSALKPLGTMTGAHALSQLYLTGVRLRNFYFDHSAFVSRELDRFTITVGGIHAGGSGKTPLSLLIAEHCISQGYEVALLSRGYGRVSKQTAIIKPYQEVTWSSIGDEPALFHTQIPSSWLGISANRRKTAALISSQLSQKAVFILDDGFQYRSIRPHRSVICLPKEPLNDFPIPKGYLRDDFQSLKRAHTICLIGKKNDYDILQKNKKQILTRFPSVPVFILFQEFDHWVDAASRHRIEKPPFLNPLILCGIGRPKRFFDLLKERGISYTSSACYEDHHRFTEKEIAQLCTQTIDGIITTEKDFMRLSTINLVKRPNICYLKIKLSFDSPQDRVRFFGILFENR
ncbi:MAG: tetraacyldisaccharide 4'-kinase [Chitinivibrionales bacterium]|nr:tetraacyldisaccharide 4'-kinase [Chitinivibrionales bacterium]